MASTMNHAVYRKAECDDTLRARGYPIYDDGVDFRFVDNNELAMDLKGESGSRGCSRECFKCGEKPIMVDSKTGFGVDSCFGGLIDGVQAACCGHGFDAHSYVALMQGWRL
jgi:hypothetical protein